MLRYDGRVDECGGGGVFRITQHFRLQQNGTASVEDGEEEEGGARTAPREERMS